MRVMRQRTKITSIVLIALTTIYAFSPILESDYDCDKTAIEKKIKSKDFNRMPEFDGKITDKDFYNLSAEDNRRLWYREIESPDKTEFTHLWNAETSSNNYYASHLDFIKYYQDKQNIELAFQFGPNMDLWAYYIFVVKKIDCCYLVTRSYYRHARFITKQYAIIDELQLDSLFSVIAEQRIEQVDTVKTSDFCGYFRDNRHNKSFYINFVKDQIWVTDKQDTTLKHKEVRPEINKMYNFVDNIIKWTMTYP